MSVERPVGASQSTRTHRHSDRRAGQQIFYYSETRRLISALQYKVGYSDLSSSIFIVYFIVLLCPVINPFKPKLFTFIVCISGIQF